MLVLDYLWRKGREEERKRGRKRKKRKRKGKVIGERAKGKSIEKEPLYLEINEKVPRLCSRYSETICAT